MKRKAVQLMMGVGMSLTVMGTTIPCFAEDATSVETEAETQTEEVSETESETEEKDDFVEGSAVLTDYAYVKGELTKDGWKSDFLKMEYIPESKVSMGVDENNKLDEYYGRNGDDKKVANSEMVALDEESGYIQMTAEVNPNHESVEDILARLKENENLDLTGKNKELKIGGKSFLTAFGVVDKECYMLGVSTDQENLVLAVKVKYKDTSARKNLLKGFAELKEKEADTETENTAETELPDEFVDAEEITEASETESVESEDTADFIHCIMFTKGAEFANKYLKKGMKITIRGSIQTGSYTNRDGVKVGTTEVVVSEHAFCESKQSSAAAYNNNQAGYQNQGQSYQGQSYQNPTPNNQSNNYSQNYAAAGGGQNTTNAALPSPNTSAAQISSQSSYRAPASSASAYGQGSYHTPSPSAPVYGGPAGAGYGSPTGEYQIPRGNNNAKTSYTQDPNFAEGFMNIPDGIDEELPFH